MGQLIACGLLVLIHTTLHAQNSKECELMAQRINGKGNVNEICTKIFQECTSQAPHKNDVKEAHNQCLKNIGDCQMAGQLSGDDLNRVVEEYERVCKGH
jgi:hypothetical protein